MPEWTVVTVIIALAGLLIALIRPVVALTQSITKLTVIVEKLEDNMEKLTGKNSSSHKRLWEYNKAQDSILDNHERRITIIEEKDGART